MDGFKGMAENKIPHETNAPAEKSGTVTARTPDSLATATPALSKRALIRGHALIALIYVTGFYFGFVRTGATGSELPSRLNTVETDRPEFVLVGNSILRAAVDGPGFSKESGIKTTVSYSNGSSSAWWYLYVKNVILKSQHKPKYVGIVFRDMFLTAPAYRVDGSYQKAIRKLMRPEEPLVQELSYSGSALADANSPLNWIPREARGWLNLKIEKRVEDFLDVKRSTGGASLKRVFAAENMVDNLYNEFQLGFEATDVSIAGSFAEQVEDSYLPHIVNDLVEQGITPIFIRSRRRRDLSGEPHPPELQQYTADLRRYLEQRGAALIDFSFVDQIQEQHYGPGDHLSKTDGRALFMKLLAQRLPSAVTTERVKRIAQENRAIH